ncbi:MAG TPA: toll/interleukin-1 receptor domain-containing protein [Anaerolineales bacterium]|nr:toll/interleukin-1 receptor domain-containing protein [Anaerolineales bacterium]
MGHIFISYSHKDKEYVHKLQKALQDEELDVWVDENIVYGTEWPTVIQKQLDTCAAFVIVMSKNSFESEMVQNELARARDKKKPIFPLLLDGENWLIIQSKQYVDVKGGVLPPQKFYKKLARESFENSDTSLPEAQVSRVDDEVKQANLVETLPFHEILKIGISGGILAALLLLYPLYIYVPSLYVSEWYNGYGILAYPLMLLSLIPVAWSGWRMERWVKTGWEAIFLGAQVGTIASSFVFIFLIATAAGFSASKTVLELMPGTILNSEQLGIVLASPIITVIKFTIYIWLGVEFAGLTLGSAGCLLRLQLSREKISFSGFNLIFGLSWWKMILGSVSSAVLILTLSSAVLGLFSDKILETARLANYQVPNSDRNLVDWFSSLPALIGLVSMLILGAISTFGKVPDEPSQQRTIAVYAIFAALLPWINPLQWFYRYLIYGVYSTIHMLIGLLCAGASVVLISFSVKLFQTSGWGKIVNTTGNYFLRTHLVNAVVFILLAAPALFFGGFYLSVLINEIAILMGNSSTTVQELISGAYGLQVRMNLIAITVVWIIYIIIGTLLKPFLWAHNGIIGLFLVQEQNDKPNVQQSLQVSTKDQLVTADNIPETTQPFNKYIRFLKVGGPIVGVILVFVVGIKLFTKPAPQPVTPFQTPGFLLTLQSNTQPVISISTPSTFGFAATQTVGAAFTQIAQSTQTIYPTSTRLFLDTLTVTPITTLTPTGAILSLDKSYPCREGPGTEFPEIVTLASGVRLPVLARDSAEDGWWLVFIKLSISTDAVCWVENGVVEGEIKDIPIIDTSP